MREGLAVRPTGAVTAPCPTRHHRVGFLADQTGDKTSSGNDAIARLLIGIVVGLLFGLVMSVVSNLFVIAVKAATGLREGSVANLLAIGDSGLTLAPLVCLVITAFIVVWIRTSLGIGRWHGPADSIHAAHRTDNELDIRAGFASTLAALVSAGGGASVGQYGPLVHFGATMGSALRQVSGRFLTTDVFIGCGVAGAIAAGFNAPIAGVVFALEAILRHFSLRAIAPIAVASISSSWFSDRFFDSTPLFDLGVMELDLLSVLPAALIAGPVFGLVAVAFMMAIRNSLRFAASSGWSVLRLAMVAAVITGVAGMFVPEALGLGSGPLAIILDGGYGTAFLVVLLATKLFLTALCIGFGLFGGVFSPALFVGAAAGAMAGRLVAILSGAGAIGAGISLALPICGMAAVASAVIGAPIAGVVIILEMTMNYEFALVAMISVVVCLMVSDALFGHSFFDRQLLDRGIDVSQGRGHIEMMESPVLDIVNPEFVRVDAGSDIETAMRQLAQNNAAEGYILDEGELFLGKVTLPTLLEAGSKAELLTLAQVDPISIKHDASLQQAIEIASGFVGESIPVIDRDSGAVLGIVTEADLFKLYLSLQSRIADLERS